MPWFVRGSNERPTFFHLLQYSVYFSCLIDVQIKPMNLFDIFQRWISISCNMNDSCEYCMLEAVKKRTIKVKGWQYLCNNKVKATHLLLRYDILAIFLISIVSISLWVKIKNLAWNVVVSFSFVDEQFTRCLVGIVINNRNIWK